MHFFPPSSFGHRRDVTDRIGPWLDPYKIVPPVDAEFQLRAANAGIAFASTQEIHLSIWHPMAEGLDRLTLAVNGQPAAARISTPRKAGDLWNATATIEAALLTDNHTALELCLSRLQRLARNRPGLGVAEIRVVPLGWRRIIDRLAQVFASIGPGRRPS
ncbi:hypothetical protein HNQ96_003691 [Aminobacter lissarensis]|uniref:Uncharacterized protein n=1 Tax=Aminobacter carboxidus TaxID=376165 RepID=A0A8E1WGC9_9HYPH|nr:hypothetical protein [Aminobacter lissarensis]MBB6467808.1 hypothetical protein [Aminobacter lissarensis]